MTYVVFGKDEFDNIKFTFIFDLTNYEMACKILDLDKLSLIYCEPISNIGLDNITILLFINSLKREISDSKKIGDIIYSHLTKFVSQYE